MLRLNSAFVVVFTASRLHNCCCQISLKLRCKLQSVNVMTLFIPDSWNYYVNPKKGAH